MNGDIVEIKRGLTARVQSVAEYLLPRGHKVAGEWRAGSINGEPGQSLGVHLTGNKAGIWCDFDGGEKGDLLDLWCAVKGCDLASGLAQARDWLGLSRPEPYRAPRREYTRPPKPKCVVPKGRVRDYLREERNIPDAVMNAYKIGEIGNDIVFPFLLPDGVLALVKTRPAEAGAKPKPTAKDCEPVLFGWQAVPANAREVVICEGEIDALSWAAYGYAAMSVPFGGGGGAKQQWIENEFERLDRFERIYLATDMDKTGDEAAVAIADRLGRHRCLRVRMPAKDANECLVAGIDKAAMDKAIADAEHLDPDGLKRPSDFTDAVTELFWPSGSISLGYHAPYGRLRDALKFRPAEVTLWSGDSGAGKSQVLSDCIVDWIQQRSRVCLSSLEMKPAQTLKRMCKQVLGIDRPTETALRDALVWLDRGLLLYDRLGKAGIDGLLAVFAFAHAKYGCDQFVIDSMMRLGVAQDDYSGQEQAMFKIVEWAIGNNVHVHLVWHSRKGARERGVPETEDVKGAMEVGANAFNIVTIFRNRKLEEELRAAGEGKDHERLDELRKKPGVIMNVAKQRNGDFEGRVGLWFDQATYRYRSSADHDPFARNYFSGVSEELVA